MQDDHSSAVPFIVDFEKQGEDAVAKADAPGGPDLLQCVAYVYIQEAKKNMGRMLGIEGFFASVAEKAHITKQMVSMVQCGILLFRG